MGFDKKVSRLESLRNGVDATLETSSEDLKADPKRCYTDQIVDLKDWNIFIVAVPTPVDKYNRPDLSPLYMISVSVGKALKRGEIMVYESTHSGCAEEECAPVLERESGMTFNVDFFCGYSSERLNPGDQEYTLTQIKKIT